MTRWQILYVGWTWPWFGFDHWPARTCRLFRAFYLGPFEIRLYDTTGIKTRIMSAYK